MIIIHLCFFKWLEEEKRKQQKDDSFRYDNHPSIHLGIFKWLDEEEEKSKGKKKG
jgi:hypothetical protein